jgi:hypothetical protein
MNWNQTNREFLRYFISCQSKFAQIHRESELMSILSRRRRRRRGRRERRRRRGGGE